MPDIELNSDTVKDRAIGRESNLIAFNAGGEMEADPLKDIVAEGFITAKAAYDAGDLGKFVVDHGLLKQVVVETHAGHTRVTTMQELANSSMELDADGNDVAASQFLGFFSRAGRIPNNVNIVDGDWYASHTQGAFEVSDPNSLYTSEHWVNFDPFEEDEPWHEVDDSGGSTITHANFGNVSWRSVQTLQHAKDAVTAIGEAFIIQQEKKVYMCVAYTAHADEEVEYRAVPYEFDSDDSKFHVGTGVPDAGLGIDGHTYLNKSTGGIYAKASGSWTLQFRPVRFRIDSGVPSNSLGFDGDSYLDEDAGKFYLREASAYVLKYTVAAASEDASDGGGGYSDWTGIGSATGAISSAAVTITLDTDEDIDDYEELYIHIEANDANDQRSVSPRFRVSDIPVTALTSGGLLVGFPGNNTDEGSIFVRRTADGTELTLDPHGSVISFPATAVTTINARALAAISDGGGGGGGGGEALSRFRAVSTARASLNLSASFLDLLNIPATDVVENIGGFTLATVSGVTTVTVPNDGLYRLSSSVSFAGTGGGRSQVWTRFNVLRSGVAVSGTEVVLGSAYYRSLGGATQVYGSGSAEFLLEAGDTITVQGREQEDTTATFTVGGPTSYLHIVEQAVTEGGGTSEQQASGSSGPRERDIVGTNIPLNAANASTAWNGQGSGTFTFPAIPRDDMDRIQFSVDVDNHYSVPFVLHAHELEVIGGGALGSPTDGATRIQCAFWSGRATPSSRNRGIIVHEPRLDYCNERRNANDICVMVHPQFNADNDWTGITIRVRAPSTSGHQFVYGKVYDWGSG